MEQTPNQPSGPEQVPSTTPAPEQVGEQPPAAKPERQGVAPQEKSAGKEQGNQNQGMTLPKVAPLPPIATDDQKATTAPTQPPSTDDSTSPVIADDVDLIEKEWVEKAKSIVDDTKEDPHKQEKEVSKLQADYLKKRYGKDVKLLKD